MITETYKDVLGYEGLYQVSDQGRVMRVKSGRILRPGVHKHGYRYVILYKNGVGKQYQVHRLVAIAFLENPEAKEQVNHIDGVKNNNSLSNLEWCTQSENQIHSRDVLGNGVGEKAPQYGKFLGDHVAAVGVIQLDLNGNEIARYSSRTGASIATGIAGSHITDSCKGRYKSAGGFKWKYI